jgi:membrane fusion protein (multidrug efflux system)
LTIHPALPNQGNSGEKETVRKSMLIMLGAVSLILGTVFGYQAFKSKMIAKIMAAQSNPPQTVSTAVVALQDWQPQLEAVGSARAVNGANLSAQVSGIVSAIHFNSGADVQKGALLLELVATDDIARLNALKATAELARITYERDRKLLPSKAVSPQQVDTDKWTVENNEAQVAQQQALVDYKSIKAPFAGRLGIRQVDLGQFLNAGAAIVTLQQLDPVFVDFYLPEQALAQIKVGQRVAAKIDAAPGQTFKGEISAVNSLVDVATRNVLIRATITNPERQLLPGMFAKVTIMVGERQRVATLPQTAIAYNSYGNIVFLIDDTGKDTEGRPQLVAHPKFVTTGETRGDQVAIISGVKEGDVVVTTGQMKLRNGSPVVVNNAVQPSDDANPQPIDR